MIPTGFLPLLGFPSKNERHSIPSPMMASSVTRENPDLYNVSNIDGTNLDTAGVCWAFTGLAAGFLITRIIARVRWDKEMFGHDFWCIGGLTCSIISCAFLQIAMNSIDGEAFPYATAQQWRDAKFWQLMSLCVGALSASLPKLAIATFLVRLLRPSLWNQWFMLWMAIWSLLSQSTLSIAMMFQCSPVESLWQPNQQSSDCSVSMARSLPAFSIYCQVFSAFVDIYLSVYPAIIIFQLKMKLRQRIGLAITLGIGLCSAAVAIYRITVAARRNSSYAIYPLFITELIKWTTIEGTTITIACSIPVLSPLFEVFYSWSSSLSSILSSKLRSSGGAEAYALESSTARSSTIPPLSPPLQKQHRFSRNESSLWTGKTTLQSSGASQERIISEESC
ncbi:hypothetical protein V2G26_006351 [Clonostachys chloroleuca]